MARFCRDHGWTIEAIAEGVGVCDKTLTRQVDLGPRGSHGKMQAHIWGEMFHCAMSRDQDKVHPALKAKSLIWLGDRLFPENVPPPEKEGGGTVINMISVDEVVAMLIKATKCPKERRAIVNALDRLGDQEQAESGGDS